MCGIFGIIHFSNKPVDTVKAEEAAKTLSHRGPDDYGTFLSSSGSTFFCHFRLSIIELSKLGHQPMTTPDGRYTIVYNGEIFNYKSLSHSGLDPESASSDTRALLNLFAKKGYKSTDSLRGMFAFAVWDEKEKSLFAARDRFGIKPFYYLINKDEFIFSSELKAIKKYKNNLTVSGTAADAFLKTGSVPAPLTIYEEVKSLPPGHYLEVDSSGKEKINQYWSFHDLFNSNDSHTERSRSMTESYDDTARHSIRTSLLDSINAHMVSDVEVGAFLSGGVDSTSIVSLMRQAGHDKIKTISITFPGLVYDEAEYSNVAAKVFATDHFEYRLKEEEVIDELDKIISVMDQPTIDGVNTYFVSKAASSFGLKVVLSGLGGDELFGGYSTFRYIPFLKSVEKIPLSRFAYKLAAPFVKSFVKPKAYEYLKNASDEYASYRLFRGLFTSGELNQLGLNSHTSIPAFNHSDFVIASGAKQSLNPLQYVSFLETTGYMANQLLRDSDIFSMCHSLELRVPFVDHLLYSDVLKYIDSGYDKNKPKRMLTDAVGDLPDAIIKRKKMGFTFPFDVWMRKGEFGKIVRDGIKSSGSDFSRQGVDELIKNFESGKVHWSRLWAVFVLKRFI